MKMTYEEFQEKYNKPFYGAIKKMNKFPTITREELKAIATIKMKELYKLDECDEKLVYYRILETLDKEILRHHALQFPFYVSDYHLFTYRALMKDADDLHSSLWTKEWIMSKSYRGEIKEERAEFMLKLAKFRNGGNAPLDHTDIELKAEREDNYAEYEWIKKYCNSEKEELIIDTIIREEPSITEIARITNIPKGTVNGFLRRFRKRLQADGITSLHIKGRCEA